MGASKEEKELRKWQAEKAKTYRKAARANMQRAKDHAQKAEPAHLARRRRAAKGGKVGGRAFTSKPKQPGA